MSEDKIPLSDFNRMLRGYAKMARSEDAGIAAGAKDLLDHLIQDYKADSHFAYPRHAPAQSCPGCETCLLDGWH